MNGITDRQYVEWRDVAFAPGLSLDVVRPEDGGPLPAILWLHGGAWRMGDRSWCPDLVTHFASRGFVMVSIDYTLSDTARFPQPLLDVRAAVRWIRAHAQKYGVEPGAIGLWGSSAGGHLAALAGVLGASPAVPGESPDLGSAAVQAVMEGYGVSDLLAPDQLNAPAISFLGGAPNDVAELAVAASPALQNIVDPPPFLIMHGAADTLVPPSQSVTLYDALVTAGGEATLYLIDGFGHGFLNRAGVDEVAGPKLDSGRLESEPDAVAELRTTTGRAWPAAASFATIEEFFRVTLRSADQR